MASGVNDSPALASYLLRRFSWRALGSGEDHRAEPVLGESSIPLSNAAAPDFLFVLGSTGALLTSVSSSGGFPDDSIQNFLSFARYFTSRCTKMPHLDEPSHLFPTQPNMY